MSLTPLDHFVLILMTIILIIGGYQFYFWTQKHVFFKKRKLITFVDSWFGHHPTWIWIYSGLYYPVIVLAVLTLNNFRHFNYAVFSYLILLVAHMIIFFLFPVEVPSSWRKNIKGNTLSEKFLKLVHKIDDKTNCFPSMHVSVAMLTAFHIMNNRPEIGLWIMTFPFLIALSAMYTKQHYFADIIPGALLGWFAFKAFQFIYVV